MIGYDKKKKYKIGKSKTLRNFNPDRRKIY